MASKKDAAMDEMMACWRGGERGNAIAIAKANKIADKDWPDGMKEHAAMMR